MGINATAFKTMSLYFKWVHFDLVILHMGINLKEIVGDMYKDVISRMFSETFLTKTKSWNALNVYHHENGYIC